MEEPLFIHLYSSIYLFIYIYIFAGLRADQQGDKFLFLQS